MLSEERSKWCMKRVLLSHKLPDRCVEGYSHVSSWDGGDNTYGHSPYKGSIGFLLNGIPD